MSDGKDRRDPSETRAAFAKGTRICYLGRTGYPEALELQEKLAAQRQAGLVEDTLLILEHPPVITLGARGRYENIYLSREELEEKGVSIHEINRGGDVTYHGPGQVVGYPIFRLVDFPGGIHRFVELLEKTVIDLLDEVFGIKGEAGSGKMTGIWVGDRKIMAIGIAVRRGVSMHGFAFNVNTDLEHFRWINPCGLSKGVTSVAELTGARVDFVKVSQLVGSYFAKTFQRDLANIGRNELLAEEPGIIV
jgi:lipoyl(octanoyl) transferase